MAGVIFVLLYKFKVIENDRNSGDVQLDAGDGGDACSEGAGKGSSCAFVGESPPSPLSESDVDSAPVSALPRATPSPVPSIPILCDG